MTTTITEPEPRNCRLCHTTFDDRQEHLCDLVGMKEIARRLNVGSGTVKQWRTRNKMPLPDGQPGGSPVWSWSKTVERWASETGRLVDPSEWGKSK